MGRRNTGRKIAMQILYQAQLRDQPIEAAVQSIQELDVPDETVCWALNLANGAWEYRQTADEYIASHAVGWSLDRMNPIDWTLLRIGLYEIQVLNTLPNIVINEILELAKLFSTEDAPRFINGILGSGES